MASSENMHRLSDGSKYFLNERPFDNCLHPFTTPLGTFRFEYRNRPDHRFLSQFNASDESAQVFKLAEDGCTWQEHSVWRDVLEFAGCKTESGVTCFYFFYPDEPKRHYVTEEHLKAFEPVMSQGIYVSRDGMLTCELLTREGPWNSICGSAAVTLTPAGNFYVYSVFEKWGALSNRGLLESDGCWKWAETTGECSIRDPVNLGNRMYAIQKIYDTLKFSGHHLIYSDDDGVTFKRVETPEITAFSLTKDSRSDAVLILAEEGIFRISLGSETGSYSSALRIVDKIKRIELTLGTHLRGADIRDYAWYKPIRFYFNKFAELIIGTWEVDTFGNWVKYRAVAITL